MNGGESCYFSAMLQKYINYLNDLHVVWAWLPNL